MITGNRLIFCKKEKPFILQIFLKKIKKSNNNNNNYNKLKEYCFSFSTETGTALLGALKFDCFEN